MKPDVVIFGDSFAEEYLDSFPKSHPLHNIVHSQLSYHKILRECGEFNSVKCYGEGGTSLWDAFTKICKSYKTGTKVVLFVTHPGRFVVNPLSTGRMKMTTLAAIEHQVWELTRRQLTDSEEMRLLNSAKDYMIYMQDPKEEHFKHGALIERIKKMIGDDLILIDTFNFFGSRETSLYTIYHEENIKLFGDNDYAEMRKKFDDIRRNHMIEENHRLLANQIINKIKTGLEIDLSDYALPSPSDFTKYFKPKKL
jgi:hypothetical protein